ncbi:methyl-accepting chemotaxis protein, partial [bacterium]|nr:methyl-accepting chemotaxis protein [bacterium]
MMRLGLAVKIYGAIALLVLVAAVVGAMGVFTLHAYKLVVDEMGNASKRAVLAERVNGAVLAVVMDSRGIYMSSSRDESEKFAAPLLKRLEGLRGVLGQWRESSPPSGRGRFNAVEAAVEEFVRFRTELVRLSRESSLPEARTFGDNDANRKNRGKLNEKLKELSSELEAEVAGLSGRIDGEYASEAFNLLTVLIVGLLTGTGIAVFVV